MREQIAEAYERSRREFPAMLLHGDAAQVDEKTARNVGSLGMALVNGLVLQWFLDAERAPTGRDLVDALRALQGARG